MGRYVARFRGQGTKPAEIELRIRQIEGAIILDESPRMMLIEAPDEASLRSVLDSAIWLVTEEKSYALPHPREKLG